MIGPKRSRSELHEGLDGRGRLSLTSSQDDRVHDECSEQTPRGLEGKGLDELNVPPRRQGSLRGLGEVSTRARRKGIGPKRSRSELHEGLDGRGWLSLTSSQDDRITTITEKRRAALLPTSGRSNDDPLIASIHFV